MFSRALIGYSKLGYPVLFTDSPSITSKMVSWFIAVTNKVISQIIKQAVPEIREECDEIQFRNFTGKALFV